MLFRSLAAAGLLAHRGLRTAVFEQAPRVGGCCGSVKHGDYQFDVGATVVLFLDQIDSYFGMRKIEVKQADDGFNRGPPPQHGR